MKNQPHIAVIGFSGTRNIVATLTKAILSHKEELNVVEEKTINQLRDDMDAIPFKINETLREPFMEKIELHKIPKNNFMHFQNKRNKKYKTR